MARSRRAAREGSPPAKRRRLPGLAESAPLLLFGSLSVILGAYLVLTHTAAFAGRFPLSAYLWTLGSIALIGGMVASATGEDLTGLPQEGEEVGRDLIVVRRSEWELLHGPLPTTPTVNAPPLPPPAEAPARVAPALVPRARATPARREAPTPAVGDLPSPPPDWWESALDRELPATPARGIPPTEDEVIATLDAISEEVVAASRPSGPGPRRRTTRPATPTPEPAPPRSAPPPPSTPPAPEVSVDHQIDDIDRQMDELLGRSAPTAPKGPRAALEVDATCVGCHRPLALDGARTRCDSCNRPLCADCLARSRAGHRPGLCPVCTMLMDGALGGAL